MTLSEEAMPLTVEALPLLEEAMPLTVDALPLTEEALPFAKEAPTLPDDLLHYMGMVRKSDWNSHPIVIKMREHGRATGIVIRS